MIILMKKQIDIGFIGAGNMAFALTSGLIASGVSAKNLKISDIDKGLLAKRKSALKVATFTQNADLAAKSEVIVLAVKPQILATVCQGLRGCLDHRPLLVSIAAGARIDDIEKWLGGDVAIVRSMPNTPALVGAGASAMFANKLVSGEQKIIAKQILDSVGSSFWVADEKVLDAVTALSGSGPAYFFLMIEAMTNAGVGLGLDEKTAQQLSIETALGASIMAHKSADSPAQLRAKVTSPAGTTEAAIEAFQDRDFESIISHAMRCAFERSVEIGLALGHADE